MSDLVTRLRGAYSTVFERSLAREAATRIERLTEELAQSRADYHMATAKRLSMESAYTAEIAGLRALCGRAADSVERLAIDRDHDDLSLLAELRAAK